jgi:hypothetical protein
MDQHTFRDFGIGVHPYGLRLLSRDKASFIWNFYKILMNQLWGTLFHIVILESPSVT